MQKRLNKLNKKFALYSDVAINSGLIQDKQRNFFIGSRNKEVQPKAGFF